VSLKLFKAQQSEDKGALNKQRVYFSRLSANMIGPEVFFHRDVVKC